MNNQSQLVLYRDLVEEGLFRELSGLLERMEDPDCPRELQVSESYHVLHRLIDLCTSHGFEGNLWHSCLAYLLVSHENAYSTACEKRGAVEGSINLFARHDFELFRKLFAFDFAAMGETLGVELWKGIQDYHRVEGNNKVFNTRIRDSICALGRRLAQCATTEEFQGAVTEFYRDFGVGKLGLHKAFRIERDKEEVRIVPITNIAHVHLDDLVGYELAKKKLIANTEAFVQGRVANNCLLYGDAGTGKSTSIKAIVNRYYEQGLRMIEVYKHQFQDLNDLIAQIKNRNYRFIIYMDDLSFEEFEIEYKYLKAVIEGGLEKKPDNVLIYATSNRRHLVREKFSDKEEREDDLHKNDTVQEKLSLVARFGEKIYFGAPTPQEFKEIVVRLAQRNRIDMPAEQLLALANQWELSNGGLSGRCAQQFINHLLGKEEETP
ncbi:MAG: ATP-binding protein [Lachnospiraceae bacterium]|nr:ATP-binding protein [Lachnospiraceae bacterium]